MALEVDTAIASNHQVHRWRRRQLEFALTNAVLRR